MHTRDDHAPPTGGTLPNLPPERIVTSVTHLTSLAGMAVGFLYGVSARWLASHPRFSASFGVMTIAFFFLVPFVLGALTVWLHERPSHRFRFFGPWIPTLATVA